MKEELEELWEGSGERLGEDFSAGGDMKCVVASITGDVTVTVLRLSVGLGIKSGVTSSPWRMSCRKSEAVVTLLIICLILEGSCVTDVASCFSVLRSPDSTV